MSKSPSIAEEIVNEFAKWIDQFEDTQPWELDEAVPEEEWDRLEGMVKRVLLKRGFNG